MDETVLLKFLQNTASEDEIEAVLNWLDADPEHMRYLNELDEIQNAFNVWEPKLKQAAQKRGMTAVWRKAIRWTSTVAAVICLSLGMSYLLTDYQLSKIVGETTTIEAPKGQRISLTLNDGTRVWLNAGSALTYPPVFARKERRVRLAGEAIFEVTHDAKCPFVVSTFACDAKVLGTKFDILADESQGVFSAALMEGKLQIINLADNESITMNPNEIVKLQAGKLLRQEMTDQDDYLWPEGIISLKGLSFEELMARLELAYNVKISVRRVNMPAANFSWGKMPVSSGIEHTLQVLQCLTEFDYEIDRRTGEIIIK